MSKSYNNSIISSIINKTCDGRLTLASGEPYSLTQIVNGTNLYFSPYDGNTVGLYDTDSSSWDLHQFSELSTSSSGLSINTNYDVFMYNNGGVLSLSLSAWSSNTLRASSIVRQDGVLVKSGSANYRYLGTIRVASNSGNPVFRNTTYSRYVWNYYHREILNLYSAVTGFNNYSTRSWRSYNNNNTISNTGGRVDFVCGVLTQIHTQCHFQTRYGYAGVGIDASSPISGSSLVHDNSGYGSSGRGSGIRTTSSYVAHIGGGYHYSQLCQYGVNSYSGFWIGIQAPFLEG